MIIGAGFWVSKGAGCPVTYDQFKGLGQVSDMSILYERAQKDKQNSEETTMIACSVERLTVRV